MEKEINKKKVAPKKAVAKKTAEKKVVAKKKTENVEVVNGDASVIVPVEEITGNVSNNVVEEIKEVKNIELPIAESIIKEPNVSHTQDINKNKPKKIMKKINQIFGYFWNGQAIDY